MWRGSVGSAYLFPALSSAGASIAEPCPVSTPRSSNPAGGFPALGSRTRSCLRPRKAGRARSKASQPVVLPQARVREAHVFPASHLVLTTQPLAQPPGRVPIHGGVSRTHLAQDEVVRPTVHQPVEAAYHHLRCQQSGTPLFSVFIGSLSCAMSRSTAARIVADGAWPSTRTSSAYATISARKRRA